MTNLSIKRTTVFTSFIFCLFIFNISFAQTIWKIEQSYISFSIKNAGITVSGTFSGVEANIIFDSLQIDNSLIEASAKAETINTQNQTRDEHLRKDEFFDVKKYPTIKIVSKSIRKTNGKWIGTFMLTMKGVSKMVEIPFTFQQNNNQATWEAAWSIDRTDYDIGNRNFLAKTAMANQVNIKVKLQGRLAP